MTYYICGIRRSGLHAIAGWLFPMMGDFIYLNNHELGKLGENDIVTEGNFNVIIGLENKPLEEVLKFTKSGKRIWVRRNIEDVIKSQLVHYGNDEGKIRETYLLHKEYSRGIPENDIVINYEKWDSDIYYRRGIAETLGLSFADINKDFIFGYGKSSYERTGI